MTPKEQKIFDRIVLKNFKALCGDNKDDDKLAFEFCPAEDNCPAAIAVTTWGYDYREIILPTTWASLIKAKVRCQMAVTDKVSDFRLPVYFKIMREYNASF
jgi:hypothetical protein